MKLEGRVALVTGGSRGLGRAMCLELAREGALVAIGYRAREDEALSVRAQIEAAGGRAELAQLDVRDRTVVDRIVDELAKRHGRLDIVVACAGVVRDAYFAALPEDAWDEVIATNLTGAMHCARAAVRPMMARRSGAIVLVSSIGAQRAIRGQAAYSASKGGLLSFMRTIAAELAPKGIRVNALSPGLFDAGMVQRMPPAELQRHQATLPAGRLGRAEECARACVFLASDDASYVIGHDLVVDGGLSL